MCSSCGSRHAHRPVGASCTTVVPTSKLPFELEVTARQQRRVDVFRLATTQLAGNGSEVQDPASCAVSWPGRRQIAPITFCTHPHPVNRPSNPRDAELTTKIIRVHTKNV